MANNDPEVAVQNLDEVIAWISKVAYATCSSSQTCSRWISVNPNGEMYPCAYFSASLPYGNILDTSIQQVPGTSAYKQFQQVFLTPPDQCRNCEFFAVCGNGCPATRILNNRLDPAGVYVYCEQRKRLFERVKQAFELEQNT
jgi:uncharacterized protein